MRIQIPEYVNFHKFKQSSKIPWIPFEEDIDSLIHACSRKVSVFLQALKESGARSGEIFKLKWIDVDLERKFISINEPEKGSLPRQFKISEKLATMLETLPRQGGKVWGKSTLHQLRTWQSTTERNSLPQFQALVCKHGIPQIKRYPPR
jgi:integrase